MEAAWKAGITVVVAAGNMGRDNSLGTLGYATINSPGNDPYVITVGAMNAEGTPWRSDDKIASYSSEGPDAVGSRGEAGPGGARQQCGIAAGLAQLHARHQVSRYADLHLDVRESWLRACPTDYFKLSGTSMATPVVSGAAALMLQENPALTPDAIKARLMKTATKNFARYTTATDEHRKDSFETQQDIFSVGAGYLDIESAIANTDPVEFSSALAGRAVQRANSDHNAGVGRCADLGQQHERAIERDHLGRQRDPRKR